MEASHPSDASSPPSGPAGGVAGAGGLPPGLVEDLYLFRPAFVDGVEAWRDAEPGVGGWAWVLAMLLSSEAADRDAVVPAVAELPTPLPAVDRGAVAGGEPPRMARAAAWATAARQWAAGDWHGASRTLDAHLVADPLDDLALFVGHQLDFFLGDARNLHRRVARSLAARPADDPRHGNLLGMLAFGLEEGGYHGAALGAAVEAVALDPADVWAVHAGAHVLEMQGQAAEGHELLTSLEPSWDAGTLLTTHLAWHDALFLLDLSDVPGALARWDARVLPEGTEAFALDLVDASALLWRLHLEGVDVGDRFDRAADAWATREPTGWYWFNEWHALLALVGAGRLRDAEAWLTEALASAASSDWPYARRCAEVGPGVGGALVAFGAGRYDEAASLLLDLRGRAHWCGGSHAQRDVLELTLAEAAVRADDVPLARAVLGERLVLKPEAPFARRRLALLDGG